jgi:hypothetical protein
MAPLVGPAVIHSSTPASLSLDFLTARGTAYSGDGQFPVALTAADRPTPAVMSSLMETEWDPPAAVVALAPRAPFGPRLSRHAQDPLFAESVPMSDGFYEDRSGRLT